MRRYVVAAIMALGLGLAMAPEAAANVHEDIVDYVDPGLRPHLPVIECAVAGTSLKTCAENAGMALVDVHLIDNMNFSIELMTYIKEGEYGALIQRVGIVAACSWTTFPGSGALCGSVYRTINDAGAAAVGAVQSVVASVTAMLASGITDVGKEIVCLVSSCSSGGGTKVTLDATRVWNDCFVSRVREGVMARGGGGSKFSTLVSDNIDNGLFPASSLSGGCFNGLLGSLGQPAPTPLPIFSGNAGPFSVINGPSSSTAPTPAAIANAKALQNAVAVELQSAARPVVDRFRAIVETASVQALEPAVDTYRDLQSQWIERAKTRAATWFTAVVPLGLVISGERHSCEQGLNTNGAKGISRWADAGAVVGSQTQLKGRTQTDWRLADAPQPWCQAKYVGAFNESVTVRRAAYQEALAGGCEKVDNDVKRLRCPLLSTALAKCISAFASASDSGHCAGYAASPLQPTGPITAPPTANPPSAAPPELPPATIPVTPAPPILRPLPRIRVPAPATPTTPRG